METASSHDTLSRGVITALDVRFVLADCTQTAQAIVLRHRCDPIAAHLLSRAVGCATLVSALLTEDERYTLRWNYRGQLSCILADCDADAHVRALITPTSLAERVSSTDDLYGSGGAVTVIKSSATATLNSGSTDAHLLDVADDLAFHFSFSDQVETALSVLTALRPDPDAPIRTCRGLMLQALPGCDLQRFDRLRNRLLAPEPRRLLGAPDAPADLADQLIKLLCQDEEPSHAFSIERTASPRFRCSCSRERMKAALATMSPDERRQALERDGHLTMTCRFCNTAHTFSPDDLADLR
ncbi:MAG: Hsp33 family molecular chaperone HslO [Oligosphaeraceae bacterium]